MTYDENDGFFDHLVPPFPPQSAVQGKSTVDVGPDLYQGDASRTAGPYGLGQRVPMLVVAQRRRQGGVPGSVYRSRAPTPSYSLSSLSGTTISSAPVPTRARTRASSARSSRGARTPKDISSASVRAS